MAGEFQTLHNLLAVLSKRLQARVMVRTVRLKGLADDI